MVGCRVLCWHGEAQGSIVFQQFTAGHTEECLAHAVNPVTLRHLGQRSYSCVIRQPEREEAGTTFYSMSAERTRHLWFTQVSNTPIHVSHRYYDVSLSLRKEQWMP